MKRRGFGNCLCLLLIMTMEVTGATGWRKIEWRGEPAWASETDACRAVVSEARGRLVHFGPMDVDLNLLNEVGQAVPYVEGQGFPDWGGHRFWLGPQKTWQWPPNPDWEYSGAEAVEVTGDRLILNMPDTDDATPGLVREYFWEGGRLGCRVSWSDTDQAFYGMHVFAVPPTTRCLARPIPTGDVPLGFVQVTLDLPQRPTQMPPGARTVADGFLEFAPAAESIKLGFPPQDLAGARGGWILVISPAEVTGRVVHPPDLGFLTQIWVCPLGGAFIELEQISPYLLPGEGSASSLVFLEAVQAEAVE